MIKPINDFFKEALYYRAYRLEHRSSRYDAGTARLVNLDQKKLDLQMKTGTLSGRDPIAVMGFLAR